MFMEALWGHIHGTPPPRSAAANVDPPPPSSNAANVDSPLPSSDATNVDPSSLVGGFPKAGGGSPADSQPPQPLMPFPSDDANIDPPLITGAFEGATGASPVDIWPPLPSSPRKLTFTVTLPAGEFDSNSNSDSQGDTDSYEDCFHGYIPLVPRGDAFRAFWYFNGTYGCPVCSNLMHRWRKLNEVKHHVLRMAKSTALRQNYKKK
jgi:hypothetical protein